MRLFLAFAPVLFACLLCAPVLASASPSQPFTDSVVYQGDANPSDYSASSALRPWDYRPLKTSDRDYDGDARITFWVSPRLSNFGAKDAPRGFRMLRNLHRWAPKHAPYWKRVQSKRSAEVLIRPMPQSDPQNLPARCDNRMIRRDLFRNGYEWGKDRMLIDEDCRSYRVPIAHEGGHGDGLYHAPECNDYWRNLTIMMPCSPGRNTWGKWDRVRSRWIVKGK